MRVYHGIDQARGELDAPVLTLGNFDGVHLGHQALVSEVRQRARAGGHPSVAMTFDPHPVSVVAPDKAPPLITTMEERTELLAQLGLDALIVQSFDRDFASLSPERFARDKLFEGVRPAELVVGFNYGFGKGRSGGVDVLTRVGGELGVPVTVLDPIRTIGIRVSSTGVRECVAAGDLPGAATLLGRSFEITGRVERGAERGRQLGFPTANLMPGSRLLPPPGVYAALVRIGERSGLPAATHVGPAPTFGGPAAVEAHLLDFSEDLYGARIGVSFIERVRESTPFDSLEALTAQIARDVRTVRQILGQR